ncbi:MAG: PAS domain S-box protein, partial [Isosphaeraceae bacterium]
IYLEPDVQESVIALFHFALRPGGYLLLGGSETIGPQDDAFETVSKKWRVYRPIGPSRLDKLEFSMITPGSHAVPVRLPQVAMGTLPRASKLAGLAQRLVLEHHAPACALVDRRNEIRYLCGPTHDYLRPPTGVLTQDLLAWAHRDLRSKLRAALDTAAREGRSVTETAVRVQRGEEWHTVDITVTPITVPREAAVLLLVAFADRPGPPASPAPGPGAANVDEERVRRLELELKVTREDLRGSIGELEAANEELQAANEEMLSSNEEYHSTNEELEASKEELQSLNEELTTLNSQLQAKFEESTTIANDLKNLLASTNIATVFLDRRFCIKRFTPAATKLFNLIPTDVGRPLGDLVKKFADPDLVSDAETVLESLVTATKEIRNDEDLWYVRQVLPYRTQENRIEGVVITFADVTSLKRMEDELLKSRDRVRAIVDTAVDGIITIDEEGTIKSFNPAAERVFGYAAAEVVGQDVTILMPSPYRNEHDAYLKRYLQTGEKRIIGIGREVRGRRKDGSTFPMDLAVSEFQNGNGRKFAGIARDITERKRLEREVLEIAAGERQRIGQELHDTTCQELAGLGLLAQGLANQVARESPAEGGVATKIANGIEQALDHLRMILTGLFPVEVDANGLMAAFDELAAQTEALTGITCRFDCAEPITLRDNMTARHLYYIANEAVTNAVKHGSPTHIEITLNRDGDFVDLGVRDNGRGFSEPLDECQGMGLRIMHYRAGLIGATLCIGRVEGGGTMVACRFSEDGHHG